MGNEAAAELVGFHASGAALDRHLADQVVLYLALCDDASEFSVACVTAHLLTNLWVIDQFRPLHYRVEGAVGEVGRVMIQGKSPQ